MYGRVAIGLINDTMPREFRRNHTLSKRHIDYWTDSTINPPSVHVFHIASGRKFRAPAIGDRRFSFAIAKDLYVTEIEGERATTAEEWFQPLEGALAGLLPQMHGRQQIVVTSVDQLRQAMMAIVALESRSRYDLTIIREAIERDPQMRSTCSANPERSAERLTLENMAHVVNEMVERNWPPELEIAHCDGDLLLSDRPYIAHDDLPHRFAILTSKAMVGYRRSRSGQFTYRYRDMPADFVRFANGMIVEHAREWIAAKTDAQLDEFIPIFSTPEWQAQRAQDAPRCEPIRALKTGLSLRPKRVNVADRGSGALI